ncbi:MAG: glycosyltransferase family 4 protein, partial [Actinobacteria bacterium]|nr:glycosyltransferase family 4 protein [Actinomycetota bacterium]
GVDHIFSDPISEEKKEMVLAKHGLIGFDYILTVASIEPRKNFERIIRVFAEIVKSNKNYISKDSNDNISNQGNKNHKDSINNKDYNNNNKYNDLFLVCAGGAGWKNEAIYSLVKEKGLEEKVKFLGFVEETDLPVIYNGAKFFMYPSIYEGFGLPVLEAMASGVPVLTSNVSSLPEVAGDAAIMVDPYNEKEIYRASINLLENEKLRKELQAKGVERSNLFTWENTAFQTLEVYKEVLK